MNTPMITLRALEPEDLDALYAIENDVECWDVGHTSVPYSRYALHDYIANASADIYADRQVRLAIANEEGDIVGLVDVMNFDPRHQRAEVGIIVKKQHEGGPVTLLAELTAGTNSTYQWQKSTDGKTWEDIEGATQAKFIPETEEAQYRCVVTGDGVDIVTQHGGRITVKATSVLEPAEVTVKLQKVDGPEEGKLTLVMNAYDMGEYTFAKSGSGWTIQNARGKYLATDGKKVTTSDKPFVWTCENGVFSASVKVSLTTLGRALRVGKTTTVYLTESDGALAVSSKAGRKAVLKKAMTE